MASASNKNTPETIAFSREHMVRAWHILSTLTPSMVMLFSDACAGDNTKPCSKHASNNPVAIESSLFGIGSTNLVDPQRPVKPELKHIPTVNYFGGCLIMPAVLEL